MRIWDLPQEAVKPELHRMRHVALTRNAQLCTNFAICRVVRPGNEKELAFAEQQQAGLRRLPLKSAYSVSYRFGDRTHFDGDSQENIGMCREALKWPGGKLSLNPSNSYPIGFSKAPCYGFCTPEYHGLPTDPVP